MAARLPGQSYRFAFVTSNNGWGGSEELWSAAAAELAADGHDVAAMMPFPVPDQPPIDRLRELRCRLTDLSRLPPLPDRLTAFGTRHVPVLEYAVRALRFRGALARSRPHLAVVSQGGNMDGVFYAKRLRQRAIPYVLIVQKAAEIYWPSDEQPPELQRAYTGARRCYFVSEHNRRLTEEQLAIPLPNAEVVHNPFLVPWEAPAAWPDEAGGWRLACVGRLQPREKGQDLLLRVLARDKWRGRPVSVSFFGTGPCLGSLQATAGFLGLSNVAFEGFTGDVAAVWRDHHGLVLPSRCEGLPLVLVEAMLSGRIAVVTDVGGNGEVVEDGRTGFLAAAPTEDSLDEALEQAWQRRGEWRAIGAAAARRIREIFPPDPARRLADRLARLAADTSAAPGEAPPAPLARAAA